MNTPRCRSIFGHKFEPRYSLGAAKGEYTEPDIKVAAPWQVEVMEARNAGMVAALDRMREKTYVHDVCVRCGHTVKPQ